MKIIKPGRVQTVRRPFGSGACPRCGCEVELEGGELHYTADWYARSLHTFTNPANGRTYGLPPFHTDCPTPGCRDRIHIHRFETREVPCE